MGEAQIIKRLDEIVELLQGQVNDPARAKWYTTTEAGLRIKKSKFTVREYCRLGRLNARKRASGRGMYREWVISDDELSRYERDGLLPEDPNRNR